MNIRTSSRPGTLPRLAASVAAIGLTGLVVLAGGTASADTRSSTPQTRQYVARVLTAVDTCEARVIRGTTLRQVQSCVGDLAAPQRGNVAEIDIWGSVLDCLSAGWTPGEGDGGFDNDLVNGCLEDQGVL